MKLIGITCIRDEASIIESFVRHTLNFVDKLIVIDNASKDGTLEILVQLVNEGLNLEIRSFASNQHQQEIAFSTVLNTFPLKTDGFDFAILLDADEFLCADSKNDLIQCISNCDSQSYPIMAWKTYIPDGQIQVPFGHGLTNSMKMRREPEGNVFYKAIVPAKFFGNCIVSAGNHSISSYTLEKHSPSLIPCRLGHFPIRSNEQALCKLILGSHTLARKKNRSLSEGFYWDVLAERLRAAKYKISQELLIDIAMHYAQPSEFFGKFSLAYDPIKVFDNIVIKYSSDNEISVIQRFDMYIESLRNS